MLDSSIIISDHRVYKLLISDRNPCLFAPSMHTMATMVF